MESMSLIETGVHDQPFSRIHGIHDPTPLPDYQPSGKEKPITPPGVDLDFDPDYDNPEDAQAALLAWQSLDARLKAERLAKSQ